MIYVIGLIFVIDLVICFGVSLVAAGPRFPNTHCVNLTALHAGRQFYKASLWESWDVFSAVADSFLFALAYRSWPLGLASPTLAV